MVVNKGGGGEDRDLDPELQRLRDIPSFLPIIRCSTNATGAAMTKDPDILEALDHRGLQALAARYQNHLRFCAGVVSTEQAEICRRVRDIDDKIAGKKGFTPGFFCAHIFDQNGKWSPFLELTPTPRQMPLDVTNISED